MQTQISTLRWTNLIREQVEEIVSIQTANPMRFVNMHGITAENLHDFLVRPYLVFVDPDDLETQPRDMWVVLETSESMGGYVIIYDEVNNYWGVAEQIDKSNYILVVAADSLAEALEGM